MTTAKPVTLKDMKASLAEAGYLASFTFLSARGKAGGIVYTAKIHVFQGHTLKYQATGANENACWAKAYSELIKD